LGALTVRLPSGISFSVGTGFSDKERSNPPALGATITFRYQELSDAGVPRFPSYVGVRADEPPKSQPAASRPSARPTKAASAAKIPVPATARSMAESGKTRHFEFVGDSSSKFWSVRQFECEVTTRWGRIGSAGQSKTKSFADEAAAIKAAERLIAEKTAEGYVER
jgi:DNA ligase-1